MAGQTISLNGRNAIVGVYPRCLVQSGVHDRLGEAFGRLIGDTGNDHAARAAVHDGRNA